MALSRNPRTSGPHKNPYRLNSISGSYFEPVPYTCSGSISWSKGGVVLRGTGENNTVILATGAARTFISISGGTGTTGTGSTVNITDTYVPCGAKTFNVTSTSGFAVGNTVTIVRPTVQSWITDIHMDSSVLGTEAWTPGLGNLVFERTITAINGTQVTIDIPLCNSIETAAYGLIGTMQRYTDARIQFSGIENLTLSAAFNDCPPFVTPGNVLNGIAIDLGTCEDCWVRNVKLLGAGNGIEMPSTAEWCSILDCDYEFPCTDQNTDAQPFAYSITGKQCLIARCTSSNGFHYHMFATQQFSGGPCVILDCKAVTKDWLDGGPHQKWAAGMLFDRDIFSKTTTSGITCEIRLQNRNDFGTGQGWSMGFSTAYNCQAPNISVQEPSYATLAPFYNWCIGGIGNRDTSTNPQDPNGEFQNFGTLVQPSSLYLEQLSERLGSSALQNMGYSRFTGNYKLLNHNSNLAAIASGSAVIQSSFVSTPADKWQFISLPGGYYEIKNVSSAQALAAASASSGALIIQTAYTANGLDQWTIQDLGNGLDKIINKATNLVLEVPNSSTTSGTQLDISSSSSTPNQQFQILTTP